MHDPSVELPPGRVIRPLFWLSDGPADHTLWARLLADHPRSGYWPLLLGPDDDAGHPWSTSEAGLARLTSPADHDASALLRSWWQRITDSADLGDLAPFGSDWPDGPAPSPPYRRDADERASAVAYSFLADSPESRLGLVAAPSGADALTAAGWQGPSKHVADTAQISAVLRDWENRFGVRVVALDSVATLIVSVAALPDDYAEALRVAAEHFAFCPDVIRDGAPGRTTIATYAEHLLEAPLWVFWWE